MQKEDRNFGLDPFVTQLFKPMPLRMKVREPKSFRHLYPTVAAKNRSYAQFKATPRKECQNAALQNLICK